MHSKPILDAIMEQTKCSSSEAQDAMHDAIESAWRTHCPAPKPAEVVDRARRALNSDKTYGDASRLRYVEPDVIEERRERRGQAEASVFDRNAPRYAEDETHDGPGLCDRCGARIYWVPLNDHAAVHTLRVPGGRITVSEGARFYMRCEIIKGDTPGSTSPHPAVDQATGQHVRHVCKPARVLAYVKTPAEAPKVAKRIVHKRRAYK
jgi:hypothetical protein